MTAYVVRHANAGDRAAWRGPDRLRPLTTSGQRQAVELAESMSAEPIDTVLSSPYLRCVQTVEPLANQRNLGVEPCTDLEEGAGSEHVIRLLEQFKGRNILLCTHGDVVQEVLDRLIAEGLVSRARASLEMGSTWVLEERHGRIVSAKYRPLTPGR
jgi:8-oxo-dGTP diphosphatase